MRSSGYGDNLLNTLYLIRGVPGAGKSSLAVELAELVFEADQYFMHDGKYKFDSSKIGRAHEECQLKAEQAMMIGIRKVAVANTFTKQWEMNPYYVLAKKYNYRVFSIIVENRHNGQNVHDVPQTVVANMKKRFEINL